jgi:hypothetical protein
LSYTDDKLLTLINMVFTESSSRSSEPYRGNPQFTDKGVEAPELAKIQLQQAREVALDELTSAQERLQQAQTDELIDAKAAQDLVDLRTKEYEQLDKEWTDRYGDTETEH